MVLFIPWLSWSMILLLNTVLIVAYFVYMCWHYRTFRRQGIPVEGTPVPMFGTSLPMFTKGFIISAKHHLKTFGDTYGSYSCRIPVLVTIDFDILREVFVKDTGSNFITRNRFVTGDKLSDGMLSNEVDYEKWKSLRSIMSPAFSSGKLKRMMPQINKCARVMMQHLESPVKNGTAVEMKDYCGCYTMDVIASTAFGIDLNSRADENNEFVKYAKMSFEFNFKNPVILIIIFFPFLVPLMPYLKLRMMKKEIVDFFTGVIDQMIEVRKDEDGVATGRVDFLRLMLDAHTEQPDGEVKRQLSRDEVLAQGILFFLAGYETTATTIGFVAYNLTIHPEAQEKVTAEIDEVLGERDTVKDEDLQNMPYLDMCVMETLRIFPPVGLTDRTAEREVTLKGIKLPANSIVRVPIHHMHHHADLYPQPEKFIPERFSTEEKAKRHSLAFMPFGAGPRQCIAIRLALLEVKVAVIHLLMKHRLVRAPETEDPIELGGLGMLKAKNGVWLKLEER